MVVGVYEKSKYLIICNMSICGPLPRKGTQVILYPDAPGAFLQDRVKALTPMSTTFTSLTAWTGPESMTKAENYNTHTHMRNTYIK